MGALLYKVSSKSCMTFEGKPVFRASYAFKPYRCDEELNKKMEFRFGVCAARRWWAKKTPDQRRNVLILYGNEIFNVPFCDGAVIDDYAFDRKPIHIIPDMVNS